MLPWLLKDNLRQKLYNQKSSYPCGAREKKKVWCNVGSLSSIPFLCRNKGDDDKPARPINKLVIDALSR